MLKPAFKLEAYKIDILTSLKHIAHVFTVGRPSSLYIPLIYTPDIMAGKVITEKDPIHSISTGRVIPPSDPTIDGLEDFYARTNQMKNIDDFLNSGKVCSLLKYDEISRILSIGTGLGDIESDFISLCKNAEQFVGIEPVSTRCDEALKCISTRHPHIKVTFYNGVFEDYEEPDEKFDIVILNHVLYHFKEDLKSTIQRAAAMLRSGGKVFILTGHGSIHANLGSGASIIDRKIRKAIEDNDLLYTEEALPVSEIDLTHEGRGYYDFLHMFVKIAMSIEERKELIGKLMKTVVPGTNIVHQQHTAFIIQK